MSKTKTDDVRTEVLTLRVSPEEKNIILKESKRLGLTLASYVRFMLIGKGDIDVR